MINVSGVMRTLIWKQILTWKSESDRGRRATLPEEGPGQPLNSLWGGAGSSLHKSCDIILSGASAFHRCCSECNWIWSLEILSQHRKIKPWQTRSLQTTKEWIRWKEKLLSFQIYHRFAFLKQTEDRSFKTISLREISLQSTFLKVGVPSPPQILFITAKGS